MVEGDPEIWTAVLRTVRDRARKLGGHGCTLAIRSRVPIPAMQEDQWAAAFSASVFCISIRAITFSPRPFAHEITMQFQCKFSAAEFRPSRNYAVAVQLRCRPFIRCFIGGCGCR